MWSHHQHGASRTRWRRPVLLRRRASSEVVNSVPLWHAGRPARTTVDMIRGSFDRRRRASHMPVNAPTALGGPRILSTSPAPLSCRRRITLPIQRLLTHAATITTTSRLSGPTVTLPCYNCRSPHPIHTLKACSYSASQKTSTLLLCE